MQLLERPIEEDRSEWERALSSSILHEFHRMTVESEVRKLPRKPRDQFYKADQKLMERILDLRLRPFRRIGDVMRQ